MSRFFIDHHGGVHFDPSRDGRAAKEAAFPKAVLLILKSAEQTALALPPSERSRRLALIAELRSKVMALP